VFFRVCAEEDGGEAINDGANPTRSATTISTTIKTECDIDE
jgi:hypothetical protein